MKFKQKNIFIFFLIFATYIFGMMLLFEPEEAGRLTSNFTFAVLGTYLFSIILKKITKSTKNSSKLIVVASISQLVFFAVSRQKFFTILDIINAVIVVLIFRFLFFKKK